MDKFKIHREIRVEMQVAGLNKVPAIAFFCVSLLTLICTMSIVGCIMVAIYYIIARVVQDFNLNLLFDNLPDKLNN